MFGTEERLMSQLESFAGVPAISKAYSAVTCHAPMWRESRDDAPKGGRGYEPKAWEPAGGVIEIDQSTNLVCCDEEDEEIANSVMQAATTGAKLDPEAEAELRRIESERAVDPIAALLRAKTLEQEIFTRDGTESSGGKSLCYSFCPRRRRTQRPPRLRLRSVRD